MRDQQQIIAKYDRIWGQIRDWAHTQADQQGTLSEVLYGAFVRANGIQPTDTYVPELAEDAEIFLNRTTTFVSPIVREYMLRGLNADNILRTAHKDVDVIAELGAGWSANIFSLWLRGAPRNARYFGCELTAGGRGAAEAIARSEPRLNFKAPAYDWHAPDYSFMPADARHVTIYSCYSIEQIPYLTTDVYTRLLEATKGAQTVRGVHIEPLGFQYPEQMESAAAVAVQKAYAIERNYNLNARQIFEELHRAGILRVSEPEVDVYGYARKNLATIIRWERA